MGDLPKAINIAEFAQARASEIKHLQNAVHAAKSSGNRRVFQTLPKHLRRRAASHNVKRLPRKLRDAAQRELNKDPAYALKHAKAPSRRRRRRSKALVAEYNRRKGTKKWLETHVWHAKRMHMLNIWGYRLPFFPNEKNVRALCHGSSKGCVMFDASYYQLIELSLYTMDDLSVLARITTCSLQQLLSFQPVSGYLHLLDQFPLGCVGPIQIIYFPVGDRHKLWIWIHPATILQAEDVFRVAYERCRYDLVYLNDEVVRFDFCGAKSVELILNSLAFSLEKNTITKAAVFSQFQEKLSNISQMTVDDPRLNFPNKSTKSDLDHPEKPSFLQDETRDMTILSSGLFDSLTRKELKESQISEGDLNMRRQKNMIPGEGLIPNPEDARIPIVLMRNSGLPQYSLLIPAGWGMAFWKQFIFSGARAGGLKTLHKIALENRLPSFPDDFIDTLAGVIQARSWEEEQRIHFEKKPPAKRINYSCNDVSSPFFPDFELLLNHKGDSDTISYWMLRGDRELAIVDQIVTSQPTVEWQCWLPLIRTALVQYWSGLGRQIHDHLKIQDGLMTCMMECSFGGVPDRCGLLYAIDGEYADKYFDHWKCIADGRVSELSLDVSWPDSSSIVGYVSSGDYSITMGKGLATTICTLTGYLRLRRQWYKHSAGTGDSSKTFVLFRNTNSLHPRLATLVPVVEMRKEM